MMVLANKKRLTNLPNFDNSILDIEMGSIEASNSMMTYNESNEGSLIKKPKMELKNSQHESFYKLMKNEKK